MPTGLTVTSRFINARAATNLFSAYDAGDSYNSVQGKRALLRLPGAMSVRVATDDRTTVGALTARGGALENFEAAAKDRAGFVLLRGAGARAQDAARLAAARNHPGVKTANPVFVDSASGLWAMITDEIVVALKPGIDAAAYFGGDWPNVRPLAAELGQYILTLPDASSDKVFAAVNRHAADVRVASAEPNFIAQGLTHFVPNDPQFPNQWHLRNTGQTGGTLGADARVVPAWDRTPGGNRSIVVAVLDVGFDLSHPDLVGNLATNTLENFGTPADNDSNGYTNDVRGWDFFSRDNDPTPGNQYDNHGTIVAGAAIASGNNGLGIAGSAYACRFLPLRIGGDSTATGSFSSRNTDIADAIYYAAGGSNTNDSWRGADVMVLSFESFQADFVDTAITFATERGRNGRGVPMFVAVGNHGGGFRALTLNGFPAGAFKFEWRYSKNASNDVGDDAVWMSYVRYPNGTVQRFDSGAFPPAGWVTTGNANWTRVNDLVHSEGPTSFAARSGVITANQTTSLITTQTLTAGALTYGCWVSSEQDADIFSFWITDNLQSGVNLSGVPFIRDGPSYPATHTNVISIGASTHWDTRSSFSQIGGKIDLLAPGGGGGGSDILTTDRAGTAGMNTAASPDGDYTSAPGTSLATPVAAGVGALMLSVTPGLRAAQVRDILRSTADKVGPVPYTNGWNPYYGAGRINAGAAVATVWTPSCLGVPLLVTSLEDSGPGTLREAIDRVNASSCAGEIIITATGTITLASSLPAVTRSVSITGLGTNQTTISGANAFSMFTFNVGTTNRLAGIRMTEAGGQGRAAAVSNAGRTIIEQCAITYSMSTAAFGGAVANLGSTAALWVTNTILAYNSAFGGEGQGWISVIASGGGGGGGGGMGGAIFNDGQQLVLSGCAFVGNLAQGGRGGDGGGNSLFITSGGTGGGPNGASGGAGQTNPGGNGGFGGGGGGGGTLAAGGAGGFGGGGGGGGSSPGGGNGGAAGAPGAFGGAGGNSCCSFAGGGGGGAGVGGAVFARSGSITMTNCSFSGNQARPGLGGAGSPPSVNSGAIGQSVGGAVFNYLAKIVAQNVTFNGNSATTRSPDIEAETLVTTVADNGFGSLRQAICNAAFRPGADTITFAPQLSGGVIRLSAQLWIDDASGAVAISAGSLPEGLAISGQGVTRAFGTAVGTTVTLDTLTISNCFSDLGGAVNSSGDLTVQRCTIVGNHASYVGGVYNVSGTARLVISSSTIAGNIADNFDGGVFSFGPGEITHSTIVGNRADSNGGGARYFGSLLVTHSVVAANVAVDSPDLFGAPLVCRYSLIGNGSGSGVANGVNGNIVGAPGAPIDPLLGSLHNNGGPTLTMHPLPGCPALDAGDPAFAPGALTDQRGWQRLSNGRIDIGAVEFGASAGHAASFNGQGSFVILEDAGLQLPTHEITVELWQRVAAQRDQFTFCLSPDLLQNRFSFSAPRANGVTYWDFGNIFAGGRNAYTAPAETVGTWTHWALVSIAGNGTFIYRNGVLDSGLGPGSPFARFPAALVLGARLDSPQEFFLGEIDEFRIWSVARTEAEIRAGMRNGYCAPPPGLWLYWKFNETSGDTVFDYSGNGRHGTLVNGAGRVRSFATLYPVGAPRIQRIDNTHVRLNWTPDAGCLESTDDVFGSWTPVAGATNGQVVTTAPARQFFRVTQ